MNPEQSNQKDLYYVALKLFLRDDDRLLILKDKYEANWDLPGGRIKPHEFDRPLEEIIARKMREELGSDVRYELGKPVVFMRHQREEASIPGQSVVRIFAIGFDAKFLSGDIKLGYSHVDSLWVNIRDFKPEEYFTGGWLNGVKEYLEKASA